MIERLFLNAIKIILVIILSHIPSSKKSSEILFSFEILFIKKSGLYKTSDICNMDF
jgi:hypothetical protein